jgi:CDP-diacylglycerol---serine O-phosphatidyltransferase
MSQPAAARYFHISNLLTFVSVLSGLCAIFATHKLQSWSAAGGLFALCALADTFNGEFGRLFSRSENLKKFGVQFDSLADALGFGLVPVVCLLQLQISSFESVTEYFSWCAAAFFYVVCVITRLGDHSINHDKRNGYVGLPTTGAVLIWSSAFLMKPSIVISTVLLLILGIAMVSPILIPRPKAPVMIALFTWAILLIGMHIALF